MITAVEAAINEAMIRKKKKNTLPMGRIPTCEKRIYDKLIFTLVQQKKKKKKRNSSTKFQFWCEISPTQNRQDCTNGLSGSVRKWGSLDVIEAGTMVLRCYRGRNKFSARWQPVGISSGAIDQQPELQPLRLFLWQSKPLKSQLMAPAKTEKFITSGTPCACVSARPQ